MRWRCGGALNELAEPFPELWSLNLSTSCIPQFNSQHKYCVNLTRHSHSHWLYLFLLLPLHIWQHPHISTMAPAKNQKPNPGESSLPDSRYATIFVSHYHSALILVGTGFLYAVPSSLAFLGVSTYRCELAFRACILPNKKMKPSKMTVSVKDDKRHCTIINDTVDQDFENPLYVWQYIVLYCT